MGSVLEACDDQNNLIVHVELCTETSLGGREEVEIIKMHGGAILKSLEIEEVKLMVCSCWDLTDLLREENNIGMFPGFRSVALKENRVE